ncbi:MAG: hypothetical protein ACRENP_10165 [Longimicrobiales bacterium]
MTEILIAKVEKQVRTDLSGRGVIMPTMPDCDCLESENNMNEHRSQRSC